MPYLRKATLADCYRLAPRLRAEDIEEVRAASGKSGLVALVEGLGSSDKCQVICLDDGKVIAMFGVVPGFQFSGTIWLLASPDLPKITRWFLKITKQCLKHYMGKYARLWNHVYAKNTVHIRWLKWAGFTFEEPITHNGHEFIPFYMLSYTESNKECATSR